MDKSDHIVDARVRRYLLPKRIVWQANAPDMEYLLTEEGKTRTLKHAGAMPSLLVDFGREIHGGIHIENGMTSDHVPVRLRVRFGESVSEAMGEPNNDHAVHDQICAAPWYGVTEIGNTGFRFVRIDMVDEGTELELKRLRAVFVFHDATRQGHFECSDERLNQIWQTGADTVHLCMQDMLWDGIKRDRLVWVGDLHPETTVVSTVFGAHDIVPNSLDFIRDLTPLPNWMNGISSYSLWWVLIQHAWFLNHGNRNYLDQQKAYLLELLRLLQTQIGADGSEQLGPHRFLDWPSSGDDTALHAGLHALLKMALDAGADLCASLGEEEDARLCRTSSALLKGHAPADTSSKQANALLVLAGLADPSEMNARVLGADPFRGLSTFYGYYVLQARAMAGAYQGCIDVIRRYWGAMLDLGATSFWEDFNLDWTPNAAGIDQLVPSGMKDIHADFGDYCYKGLRHSLCHGWAAGPTAWLSEHVLGFRPLEPGSRVLAIQPHLGDLEYACGRFPTPAGTVSVKHMKTAQGTVRTEIDAPAGIRIVQSAESR